MNVCTTALTFHVSSENRPDFENGTVPNEHILAVRGFCRDCHAPPRCHRGFHHGWQCRAVLWSLGAVVGVVVAWLAF